MKSLEQRVIELEKKVQELCNSQKEFELEIKKALEISGQMTADCMENLLEKYKTATITAMNDFRSQ